MKSNTENPKPLPGVYVECPVPLLEADLSSLAVKLWLVIKAHCIKREDGFPGITRLSKVLRTSRTWTLALISELESKGFLAVERRKGKVNLYCPQIPSATGQVELTSQPQLTGQVELTLIRRTKSKEINQSTQPSAEAPPSVPQKKPSRQSNKPKKPADSRITQLKTYYGATHRQCRGIDYVPSHAADAKHFQELLAVPLSADTIQACIDLFLADKNPWLNDKPRSVGMLRSQINTYLQQLSQEAAAPIPAAHRKWSEKQ